MDHAQIQLGLKENWKQFTLLVIVNAFVGGMIGMERTIFPQFAEFEFGVASKTAVLSFITAFGLSKAIANYYTGKLANKFGRRNLLLAGWLLAILIPFILINAPSWNWVIFANVLLGISQGLTWSSTVVMKIDLVGEKDRGFAMGLNEFAGYFAVGIIAFLTGYVANKYGVTPYPFYIGIFIAVVGFILTFFWVKDTRIFVQQESLTSQSTQLKNVFWETTLKNKTLSSVTQAGLINNLNDGMIWGLLPIVLLSLNYNNENIGLITAIYPIAWGIGQLFTGKMSDHYSKKAMLYWGMLLQGLAILFIPYTTNFYGLMIISGILGLGTALVYPTFLSAIAQATSPAQRAESIGTFRLWRDLGYAFGAVISGVTADILGIEYAILFIGVITIVSALIIKLRMPKEIKSTKPCVDVNEVKQAIQLHQKVMVIDVRSEEEFKEAHIPNAIHISLQELPNQLDKNYQYVTACGKGAGRSVDGLNYLLIMGLTQNGYVMEHLVG
jgi:MFS family permease